MLLLSFSYLSGFYSSLQALKIKCNHVILEFTPEPFSQSDLFDLLILQHPHTFFSTLFM